MKKIMRLFYLLALVFPALSCFSQNYKKIEDTTKLNKEYVNVSNEIADLQAKLTMQTVMQLMQLLPVLIRHLKLKTEVLVMQNLLKEKLINLIMKRKIPGQQERK